MRTLPRLRSLSPTSVPKTRILYIWWFHASGFGGLRFSLRRVDSSMASSIHQVMVPSLPFQVRCTVTGIIVSRPSMPAMT